MEEERKRTRRDKERECVGSRDRGLLKSISLKMQRAASVAMCILSKPTGKLRLPLGVIVRV